MQRAVLKAADFRDASVLEVGAGDGRLTYQYAAEARSVVEVTYGWRVRRQPA